VTRSATPKLGAYAGLAGVGLLAALVLGRAELAVLAAPFAIVLFLGLALSEAPDVRVALDLDSERQVEGEEVNASLEARTHLPVSRLELLLDVPDGLETDAPNPVLVALDLDERRELEVPLRCAHWGAYLVGRVHARVQDRFGLLTYERAYDLRRPLKVYPGGESLDKLLRPLQTLSFAGSQTTGTRGEGIEFADLRPFAPGDRIRRINWRATARRGQPWVNETHPERNTDVVIFLDTFAEARSGAGSTLDLAVQAAGSLAAHYIRAKDRVGLVAFGGVLNWLTVSSGVTQLYRVLDSLLDAEIFLSYAWKDIEILPRRTLPPNALVIALSPLLDERSVRALIDLRARGFDLAVVEISPVPFVEPGKDELDQLAYRLWLLRRDALRASYLRVGVPVVEWRQGDPLQAALEEVRTFRRHARVTRA
jgi:uncharacterized protein (DUF58 family)